MSSTTKKSLEILRMTAGFPDPFAVATIGVEQTKTTYVIKKPLNPYWHEVFDMYVGSSARVNSFLTHQNRKASEDSILAIQIFDQKKFKKKDQGFLGVINVRIGDVIDMDVGGEGDFTSPSCLLQVG